AWAYEALSFGGYWAWDPVENMSLVPWLVLIAGLHTNLVANSTGYSIRSTYLFYLLTFVMIVYSTFLTRSGILGDTSVHAFTEMGLETQLIAFIFTFTGIGLFLFFKNRKSIPAPQKEESIASREFWMFIGSLVLLFSATLITLSTSLPVYNKLYQIFIDPLYQGGVINDPVAHHNKYQLWIGVFIALLSGTSQFLRFREMNWQRQAHYFFKHIGIAFLLSAIAAALTLQVLQAGAWQYKVLLFFAFFTIFTNLDYIFFYLRPSMKVAGAALSHVGFGIMLLGILFSGLNKRHISSNAFAQRGLIEGFSEEEYQRNILLLKNKPMFMNGYEVTYVSDTLDRLMRTFKVNYKKKDPASGAVIEDFDLYPNVLYDKSFTKIAASNPSTKRYWNKDIFTHIASLPAAAMDINVARAQEDSLKYQTRQMMIGDTLFGKGYFATLKAINKNPTHPDYEAQPGDKAIAYLMSFTDSLTLKTYDISPIIVLRGSMLFGFAEEIQDMNLKVKLSDESVRTTLGLNEKLDFQEFHLKKDDSFHIGDYTIIFSGFNTKVNHPEYKAKDGDIAVAAILDIFPKGTSSPIGRAEPIYLIRGKVPYNIADELEKPPLLFHFMGIDPAKEEITLNVAVKSSASQIAYPFDIAHEVPRSDFIVLEAILFPGINLFWLGSLILLFGLTFSMFVRKFHGEVK
ncbi:MAG TPA: cytochrome c assembly protein, partial [Phaeodactylibacter sp.]|nr:cytochrome c assembly protein [Phaeodactylibacter sp.]